MLAEETIIELVMISILAFAFFAVLIKVNDHTLYQQKQTARDLSSVMDAVNAAPKPWLYTYIGKKEQFIEVEKESCKIRIRSLKKESLPVVFTCGQALRFAQLEQKNDQTRITLGT